MRAPDVKIIFVDLDWTLLDHASFDWDYVSLNALRKVQKRGVLVYLCTARPYDSICDTGFFSCFDPDGVIATNGGVIFQNGKLMSANIIPEEVVAKVEKVCHKHHLVLEFTTPLKRYFTKKKNKYVDGYFESYHESLPEIIPHQYKDVASMLLFASEKFDEVLKKELPKGVKYVRYHPFGVTLDYLNNQKGKGIKKVLKLLNIDKSNAMSFGDGEDDISMFNETGISVALENAKEKVKPYAQYVSLSVSDHGVAHGLKKFGLIKDIE